MPRNCAQGTKAEQGHERDIRLRFGTFEVADGKNRLLLMLVGVDFIFMGLDVALAYAVNKFVPAYEWIPILYAPLGAA